MYMCMERHKTFTDLLRGYSNLIWSMCHHAAHGDLEQCRDLFQDVSLRLWQHFGELRPDAQPHEKKAWVEWQTRHVLEHAARRQRPEPMGELPEQPDGDALVDIEIRSLINDLLAQLQPDERQLVQMRLEGYSAGEIADKMGLSRDTVYQRIHRTLLKARRVLIVVLLLLLASSIAIAVVPSWRQWIFGADEPATTDTLPISAPPTHSPAPSQITDTVQDTVVSHHTWVAQEPLPHLVAAVDTVFPVLPLTLSEPCGCPEGYRRKPQEDSLEYLSDPCEPIPVELPEATIRVVGNNIVVEGVGYELVDVYDAHGRLVATTQCNGHCTLTIRPDRTYTSSLPYWVQVGDRPRERVFLDDVPKWEWYDRSLPTSFRRIYVQ